MCIFIRFFIFADPPPDKRDYQSHVRQQRQAKLLPETDASPSVILEKTYYDLDEHSPETLDWFSILVAQAISHIRDHASQDDHLLKSLNSLLNSDKIPSFIGPITVSKLDIGQEFPIFSNCRIVSVQEAEDDLEREPPHTPPQTAYVSPNGSAMNTPHAQNRRSQDFKQVRQTEDDTILEAQIDVDLADHITLGIDTRLVINFPRPNFAFLPVNLSVSIVNFSGTLKVSLRNQAKKDANEPSLDSEYPDSEANRETEPEEDKKPEKDGAYITVSFSPNYQLDFEVNSLIGAASKLQDVTKIAQLVESRLRKIFEERFVYPNERKVYLPSIFPKASAEVRLPVGSGSQVNNNPASETIGATVSSSNQGMPTSSSSVGGGTPLSNQAMKDFDHHLLHRSQHTQQRLHPRSFSSVSQLASNTAINMPARPQFDMSYDAQDSSAII